MEQNQFEQQLIFIRLFINLQSTFHSSDTHIRFERLKLVPYTSELKRSKDKDWNKER